MEKAIDVHHSYAKHMACLTADDALAKMHAMLSKNLLGNTSGILPANNETSFGPCVWSQCIYVNLRLFCCQNLLPGLRHTLAVLNIFLET